jgi:hypothetical protein
VSSAKNIKWTLNIEFFKRSGQLNIFVSMNGKALCLICSKSIVVLKEYNIARHYNSMHKEKYKHCVSALRREKVAAL